MTAQDDPARTQDGQSPGRRTQARQEGKDTADEQEGRVPVDDPGPPLGRSAPAGVRA
ncbi:hypothetical protein GCM10010512_02660 [Streptomyces thermoviolaceus subsp. thermoviolaceus]|nr:hypothetical protein GCM10010499_10550 [Streptomyces thermoviolaceus subsp. apingens]GHA75729.1 hypothetical protein GCM10010512_02660 [Streptomyces thermoviolaceus subsp. thermoviolaceus]